MLRFPSLPFARYAIASVTLCLAQQGWSAPADEEIGRLADSYVQSGQVPGIIVGIWRPGSGLTLIKRGVSDVPTGAPMDRANFQRIGSITKSFTVTRLLQLVDEGKISLDDPIDKYVPNVKNGSATLRELADMTSGIFNYTEDKPFVIQFAFHRTEPWTDEKLVAVADSHPPYFSPGKRWYYSNTNTVLLGMMVERVTGHPLRTEITRHIIRPLGLGHTIYPTGIFLPKPFSHGYATLDSDVGRIDVTEVSPSGFSGAGAMISTLDDLHLWGRALARGSLLSRRSQQARLRMIDSSKGIGPYYDRYGLALGRINGWLGHTGDLFGYQSLVMHNLVGDETVVIFVNASNPAHLPTEMFQKMTAFLSPALPSGPATARVLGKRHRATGSPTVSIRGRAFSEAGILLVEYAHGTTGYQLARGTNSWRFTAHLRPGQNEIFVRSVDRLGRKSKATRIVVVRN